VWPRLNAVIKNVATYQKEAAGVKRLALWLRSKKGRIVGNMRFTNDLNDKTATWWIEAQSKSGAWDKVKAGAFVTTHKPA
jgi:hypothetical protein